MQETFRQHVQQLMKDHKRRSLWKRATAVLSAVVLLSTFLSLRNFAIAVTEEKAAEAQISEAVQAALAETASGREDVALVTTEFTPEATAVNSDLPLEGEVAAKLPEEVSSVTGVETAAAPETVSTDGTDTSSVGSADSFPSRGSSEALTTDIVDNPAPLAAAPEAATSMLRMAPAATLLGAPASPMASPTEISSAEPVSLRIYDAFGNPAKNVYTNDLLTVEVTWRIGNTSEIKTAGDHFTIALPTELDFVAGSGSFRLAEAMSDSTATYPAGTSIADYKVSDHTLTVTFTEAGVDLNALNRLTYPSLMDSLKWSSVRLGSARFNRTGSLTPSASIGTKSVGNAYGAVTVADPAGSRLTDVNIKSVKYYNQQGTETTSFGSDDEITIRVAWEALSENRVITDGDWFEIELPEQLSYSGTDRRTTDDNGNVVRSRVMRRESDSKWVLRVDFENIVRGYSKFSSTPAVKAYVGDVVYYGGSASFNAVTRVAGGTASSSTRLTITETGSTTPAGLWRVRTQTKWQLNNGSVVDQYPGYYNYRLTINQKEDYVADYSKVRIAYTHSSGKYVGRQVHLYVIANHGEALVKNPLADAVQRQTSPYDDSKWVRIPGQTVDFVPGDSNFTNVSTNGESNYLDAYCAEMSNLESPGGDYTFTNVENKYNSTTAAKIRRIIATAYPYVSLDQMAQNLGVERSWLNEDIAVTAVQAALWETVDGDYAVNNVRLDITNGTASENAKVRSLIDKIKNFRYGSADSYSFTNGPTVTFSTVGSRIDATVSGAIGPADDVSGFTGTFTNGSSSTNFAINANGTFSATLRNVSRSDLFRLSINGATISAANAYYFRAGNNLYGNGDADAQSLIAGRVYMKPIHLDWEYQEDDKREVRVVKQWKDKNGNVITGWPQGATVEMTLYRQVKGGAVEKVVPVNALQTNPVTLTSSGQAYSWTNLPLTDAKGNVYTYSVVETKVPDGYELVDMIAEGNSDKLTFTAINEEQEEEKTKVKVIKEWRGVPDNKKDDFKAVVQLFARIDKGPNVNNGNGWKTPVLIKDRQDVTNTSGLNVTGTYKVDLTTTTPSYAGGYADTTAELTKGNNWNVTFNDLPKYDAQGNPIQYLIREIAVYDGAGNDISDEFSLTYNPAPQYPFGDGNYYAFVPMEAAEPTVTVTNTAQGTLTVEKKWVNADGLTEWSEVLPGGIKVELSAKRNGQEISALQLAQILGASTTVELNAANNWSHTWDYVYTKNIKYYVKEVGFVNGNADRYVRIDENGKAIPYDEPVEVVYDQENKVFRICLVNKRKPVEVELIKEDKRNPDRKLEGATFALYDWKGNQVLNPSETDGLFKTDANGTVRIGDPKGLHLMISQKTLGEDYIYKYVLIEQEPPAGYIKRNSPLTVTFHVEIDNGNPLLKVDKVDDVSAAADLVTWEGGELKLHIRNEQATYTLPETGGRGTAMPVAIGAILMLMSAGVYILRRKRDTEVI